MDSRLLMTLEVAVVGALKIGAVPHGTRITAPIASGHFEGSRLRGEVLPGRDAGASTGRTASSIWTCRMTLETDDGARGAPYFARCRASRPVHRSIPS
jgi:hypothetical protein